MSLIDFLDLIARILQRSKADTHEGCEYFW